MAAEPATSTTCHVTMIIITTVVATSIVPEMTKVIANGMSKSKMQKSDEACIVDDTQTQSANLQQHPA
jgi:hypothetical protein